MSSLRQALRLEPKGRGPYQRGMTVFTGETTTLLAHHRGYADARHQPTSAIRLWPRTETVTDAFVSATLTDVLLTSLFVPIDLGARRMFLDQTYSGANGIPVRYELKGGRYTLESEPVASAGRHVVIGGPVDLVWYHWLFNWCPRLLLAKTLRPDLFEAEDVRFVMHPHAMREPYRAILDTFGLDENRFLVVDPDRDYRLEQATLVSFPDQNKLFPSLVEQFSDHLLDGLGIDAGFVGSGVFASRQALPPPKRRVANYAAIEPVLERFGIRPVSLGALAAAEQARLFYEAPIVVGAHGSDLSNILFCRPGTPVVVIENSFSIAHNLHVGLLKLAEVLGLEYHLLVSATSDDVSVGLTTAQSTARDYMVDPAQLDRLLARATGLRP